MSHDSPTRPVSPEAGPSASVLRLRGAGLRFGDRELWSGVDLDVRAGEFVAVLGANGSGKTSLLRAVLGQQQLSAGELQVLGEPVHRGNRRIGYIPQQRLADEGTPLRARDLLGLGIDGHRFGLPLPSRSRRAAVDALLEAVGATAFADAPIGSLSGGEQQRVRVGQALAGDPALLLCDEPLIALDLAHQRAVSELIDRHRRERNLGVLFVTHDVNPVLGMVDRVLYLAGGRFRIGTPDEVLRSEVLSELYDAPVDVIRARGRVIVVGAPDHSHVHEHEEGQS
ncbi:MULTISPECIES: metal ABC transporter ATP-binding protein [unclassified Rathayibacter]|uniref:metal ABC transporter ATP-binding protein n=1 Tax=unclassified Rathayibacter TaxID=2609250 RepID=UPI000CE91E9E|nr:MULTISPECIES: ABC transporter ATP-binding protein [unclassified Rathayibacter]PPF45079.1 ABC transporter ATP-binding protein [Rathayibacter sp. AY1A1]PPG62629.1 ABC transporter ATP-binding protein [Rathayibacter sp. AY2B7]PPG85998.1 ABC transporter ATP-binding protein [Rathayibacter sp. AY1H2]PPG98941.1 ABC transporter ATP-binding protein [Rathayibacter sp. AY1G9]PPH04759.1 ABC transporter ATP-binding protein [Rathayibacter sp. AY1H3]